MENEIIIAIIGVVTTFTSGLTSWIFARKKYNSEVDHNRIENMNDSLEFYTRLSDDNKDRLDSLIERNQSLEQTVNNLTIENQSLKAQIEEVRRQMLALTLNICMDLTCANRVREKQNIKRTNGKNKDRFDQSPEHSKRGS